MCATRSNALSFPHNSHSNAPHPWIEFVDLEVRATTWLQSGLSAAASNHCRSHTLLFLHNLFPIFILILILINNPIPVMLKISLLNYLSFSFSFSFSFSSSSSIILYLYHSLYLPMHLPLNQSLANLGSRYQTIRWSVGESSLLMPHQSPVTCSGHSVRYEWREAFRWEMDTNKCREVIKVAQYDKRWNEMVRNKVDSFVVDEMKCA